MRKGRDMISEVFLTGRLGEKIGPTMRYVEIERLSPAQNGGYEVDKVPVETYAGVGSHFMKAPLGSYIALKGHLETHKEYGLSVYIEMEEITPLKEGKKAS